MLTASSRVYPALKSLNQGKHAILDFAFREAGEAQQQPFGRALAQKESMEPEHFKSVSSCHALGFAGFPQY